MKAADLMIGDWVFAEGKLTQVTDIDESDGINREWIAGCEDCGCIHEKDIEPIPLTPEILEKNWLWEKDPDRNPNCLIAEANTATFSDAEGKPHSWVQIQDISSIECSRWYLKIWGKGKLGISGYIGYVHELQHALRICGIKKKIEI